jgi:hypothetical protein
MLALGCLALIVFPLIGFVAGLFLGGEGAGAWGAGLGALIALTMTALAGFAIVKAGEKRKAP